MASAPSELSHVSSENRLLFVLDEVEKRVENFRETATSLEQEKEALLQALHMLGNSRELLGLTPCEYYHYCGLLQVIDIVVIQIEKKGDCAYNLFLTHSENVL